MASDLVERAEQACLTMEAGGTAPARAIIRELAAAFKAAAAERQRFEDMTETMVPISEHGTYVFIDGFGSLPIDFSDGTDLTAARADIERLTGLRDQWQEAAGNWQGRAEKAESENERLREGLRPFAAADRAIGGEPGPFRFETERGYRLIEREDLRRARALLDGEQADRKAP